MMSSHNKSDRKKIIQLIFTPGEEGKEKTDKDKENCGYRDANSSRRGGAKKWEADQGLEI